jgi:phenylpyruvate tautomerase PptA (4-oxalocrotonate tautomerase family)
MPIIYLSYTEGSFTQDGLNSLAEQVTKDAIEQELLPYTNDWVRSTTLIYAREYPQTHVFNGGRPASSNFITLDINVIQGGYSAATKTELIKLTTNAVEKYGNLPKGEPRRVYVFLREVAEANLGFDGQTIDLTILRDPPKGLTPL